MGTRAKIKVTYNDKELIAKYYPMDGHVENWSTQLTAILKSIEPKSILKLKLFLNFFTEYEYIEEDFLSYLCEVQILKETNEYNIILTGFKGEAIFEGNLDEFEDRFC